MTGFCLMAPPGSFTKATPNLCRSSARGESKMLPRKKSLSRLALRAAKSLSLKEEQSPPGAEGEDEEEGDTGTVTVQ